MKIADKNIKYGDTILMVDGSRNREGIVYGITATEWGYIFKVKIVEDGEVDFHSCSGIEEWEPRSSKIGCYRINN